MNYINIWDDSIVAESLAIALDVITQEDISFRKGVDKSKQNLLFSYNEDFEYLWDLENESSSSLIEWTLYDENPFKRNVIVVWDKTPTSKETEINIEDYVTPFDWALAFSLQISRKTKNNPKGSEDNFNFLPSLSIRILDISSGQYSDSFSCKIAPMFFYALPWVQTYSTSKNEINNKSNKKRTNSFIATQSLEDLYADIVESFRSVSFREAYQEAKPQSQVLNSLVELWRSNLIKPESRHNVANLIAPTMLISGLPQVVREKSKNYLVKGFQLRNALNNLVKVIGLLKEQPIYEYPIDEDGLLSALKKDDLFLRRNSVRTLLLDDQYSLGYQHFVAGLLFGKHYEPDKALINGNAWTFSANDSNKLRCNKDVKELFSFFESVDVKATEDWRCPRLLDTSEGFDILLLDLRLWTNSKERGEILTRIINICNRLNVSQIIDEGSDLFDPLFKRALEKAKSLADYNNNNNNYDDVEAISLFPLLLSYYDPSLPIVLFSSTHQRAILELVSHRPNIITNFTKPILSGFGEENNPAEFVENAAKALKKAIDMHELRIIWMEIVKRVENTNNQNPTIEFNRLKISPTSSNSLQNFSYKIDKTDLVNLSLEFQNTMLTGRFADSLLAPDNWFEALIGGKIVRGKNSGTFLYSKFPFFFDDSISYETRLKQGWGFDDFKSVFSDWMKEILSDKIVKNAFLFLLNDRNWIKEACKNESLFKDKLLDLKLTGLVPRNRLELIAYFLEANTELLADGWIWTEELKLEIDYTLFAVIKNFRNLRAHYRVKPEESIELRNYSLWLWLWTLFAIVPLDDNLLKQGEKIVNNQFKASDFATKFNSSNISFVGGVTKFQSVDAVKKIMEQLSVAINDGWFDIDNQMLKNALIELVK